MASVRAAVLAATLAAAPAVAADQVIWQFDAGGLLGSAEPMPNGHVLIADKGANRVIEVARSGLIVQATYANQPDHARLIGPDRVLVANTDDNTVIETNLDGGTRTILYGDAGSTGCSDSLLNAPSFAGRFPNGDMLITDQGSYRVLQVTSLGAKVWQYGELCTSGTGPNQIGHPFSAERMPSGDVLIADNAGCRVLQVAPSYGTGDGGTVVWQYGQASACASGPNQTNRPLRATALSNGNVLIAEQYGHRVIEVAPTPPTGGTIVWQYGTTGVGGNDAGQLNWPFQAERLADGNTLIVDQVNRRVIIVGTNRDSGFPSEAALDPDAGSPPIGPDAGAIGPDGGLAALELDVRCGCAQGGPLLLCALAALALLRRVAARRDG